MGRRGVARGGLDGAAQAADLSYGSRAPYTVNQPLNAFSWAGPYLGGNLGYAWGHRQYNPTKPSGFSGGVQAGYNWQSGPIVFGVEGDLQVDRRRRYVRAVEILQPVVRHGRAAGSATPSTTSCFMAPAVWRSANCAAKPSGFPKSTPTAGWTAGVGAEFGLAQNWTAKIEYLYVDLSDRASPSPACRTATSSAWSASA